LVQKAKKTIRFGNTYAAYARSIDLHEQTRAVIAGLKDGRIVTFSESSTGDNYNTLIDGHSAGETWGLVIDEKNDKILTSGDDNKLIIFDPSKN
jgi:WD40 repeat protein